MKAVDVGRKIFDLISTTNVVDVSFVQGWFRSCVLSENLLLDMPHEQTRTIRSQTAPYRDPSRLSMEIPIERECVQCKDQFCDEYTARADCEKFYRRLRLKAHFSSPQESGEMDISQTPDRSEDTTLINIILYHIGRFTTVVRRQIKVIRVVFLLFK